MAEPAGACNQAVGRAR